MIASQSKIKGMIWLMGAGLLAATTALGLPYFAKLLPLSLEKKIASRLKVIPNQSICDGTRHPKAKALFDRIITRLHPIYDEDKLISFNIRVAAGETVNAFAYLGGQIFVYEGLIKRAESAEELAGVLAHEMEHVRQRHVVQGILVQMVTLGSLKFIFSGDAPIDPELANVILNLSFTKSQETQADEGGFRRLRDAKIDLIGFEHFFRRMMSLPSVPGFLSDHPAHEDRIAMARKFWGPSIPIMTSAEWATVKTICQ